MTHRAPDTPDDSGIVFLSNGIDDAVATARAAAEAKNVGDFGANTAQQCLQADLVDEIVVHLAPVLLGEGVRLYGGPDVRRIDLECTAVAESGRLTDLRFPVAK